MSEKRPLLSEKRREMSEKTPFLSEKMSEKKRKMSVIRMPFYSLEIACPDEREDCGVHSN